MEESQRPLLHELSPQRNDSTISTARQTTRRYLNSKIGHYAILLLVSLDCACIFSEFLIKVLSCEGKISEPRGQAAEQAVGIISLIFSCLFVLELLASIWAFGFQ